MDDDEPDDDELTEAEEEAWCDERRAEVERYLSRQDGLRYGEIGEWPAWHMAPYVSVWAIESLKAPGWVGWWVVCGDLPSDCCERSEDRDNPRRALRHFAESWLAALRETPADALTIGETELPVHLGDLLRARAAFLLEMVADDEVWPPDAPDSDSSTSLH